MTQWDQSDPWFWEPPPGDDRCRGSDGAETVCEMYRDLRVEVEHAAAEAECRTNEAGWADHWAAYIRWYKRRRWLVSSLIYPDFMNQEGTLELGPD